MGDFSKNAPTESELRQRIAARHREGGRDSRHDRLASKAVEKPYTEANAGLYELARVFIFITCGFFIVTAWWPPFEHLRAYFSFLDFLAPAAAFCVALTFLGAIEYARYMNAKALLESWFFRQSFRSGLLIKGALLTVLTAAFSWFGAEKTVSMVVPSPKRPEVRLESTEGVVGTMSPQIARAEADAENYKKTRSWLGKLDPADGRRYAALQNHAAGLRSEMAEAIKRVEMRNAKRNEEASAAFRASVDAHENARVTATRTVIIAILVGELLFWLCYWFKEQYEYFEAEELDLIKPPGAGGGGGGSKKAQSPPGGLFVLHPFKGGTPAPNFSPLENSMRPPVIQPQQTILETLQESVNYVVTYWHRCREAVSEGKNDQAKSNFKTAFDRAGQLHEKHGFVFKTVGDMLYIGDPRPAAKRQECRRDGRAVAVVLPPSQFQQEVAEAEKAFEAQTEPLPAQSAAAA